MKLKKFYNELYVGFVHYGKNFYSDDFSSEYGEILLYICFFVIFAPIFMLIAVKLEPWIIQIFGSSYLSQIETLICVIITAIPILVQIIYLHSNNRFKTILEVYSRADKQTIQALKKRSGLFAVFSFICFIFLFTSIFVYLKYSK